MSINTKQKNRFKTDVIITLLVTDESKQFIDELFSAIARFKIYILKRIRQYIMLYDEGGGINYTRKMSINLNNTSVLDEWVDNYLDENPGDESSLCYLSTLTLRGIGGGLINRVHHSSTHSILNAIDKEIMKNEGDVYSSYQTFVYNAMSQDDPKIINTMTLKELRTKIGNSANTRHIKSQVDLYNNQLYIEYGVSLTLFGSITVMGVSPYLFSLPHVVGSNFNRYTIGKFGDTYYVRLPASINVANVRRRWVRDQVKSKNRCTLFIQPIVNQSNEIVLNTYWKDDGSQIHEDSITINRSVIWSTKYRILRCNLTNPVDMSQYHSLLARSKNPCYLYSYIRYINANSLVYRILTEVFSRLLRGLYLHDRVIIFDAINRSGTDDTIVRSTMDGIKDIFGVYCSHINCHFAEDVDRKQYDKNEKIVYRHIKQLMRNRYRNPPKINDFQFV